LKKASICEESYMQRKNKNEKMRLKKKGKISSWGLIREREEEGLILQRPLRTIKDTQ